MASPTREEADALVSLEERILRAVELVNTLRQEKEAMEAKLQPLADLQTENERLREEVESLRAERKQVRGRIEKLLGQLDTISS